MSSRYKVGGIRRFEVRGSPWREASLVFASRRGWCILPSALGAVPGHVHWVQGEEYSSIRGAGQSLAGSIPCIYITKGLVLPSFGLEGPARACPLGTRWGVPIDTRCGAVLGRRHPLHLRHEEVTTHLEGSERARSGKMVPNMAKKSLLEACHNPRY